MKIIKEKIKPIASGADFDATGKYRFKLWRIWDKSKPTITFIMLNPSTANAQTDDPTIRRCINFARSWGYGGIEVVNLFALVSSESEKLLTTSNSIGTDNDLVILKAASQAAKIIIAWGAFKEAKVRGKDVLGLLYKYDIYCLGKTKEGHPKHPLYLRKDLEPIIFTKKQIS